MKHEMIIVYVILLLALNDSVNEIDIEKQSSHSFSSIINFFVGVRCDLIGNKNKIPQKGKL